MTSSVIPPFSLNCYDVMIAEKITKMLGEKIEFSYLDYKTISVMNLDPIIKKMPFCVHGGINFYKMIKRLKESGADTVYCGQNMDALYNLGPTEGTTLSFHGDAQWFKRLYLSEDYIKTMPDVDGDNSLFIRMVAFVELQLFRKATHQKELQMPCSAEEFIYNFNHSNDYTGEKLHEQMTSVEDSHFTYEYPEHFKILPQICNWGSIEVMIKGDTKVSERFSYTSDNNKEWLTILQLQKWIEKNRVKIDNI